MLGAEPGVAVTTNLTAEGGPLANRRAGVDYTDGAVNVNACNVNVLEVAINTSQEQNE